MSPAETARESSRVLIVLAHPEPRSLNGCLAEVARATLAERGHEVVTLDLQASGFDPVLRVEQFASRRAGVPFEVMPEQTREAESGVCAPDVAASQRLLRWTDVVILQFPLWWWSMPAILKGWVDRVLSAGFAYEPWRLEGRRAMLSVTAETDPQKFAAVGAAHPLHAIERGVLGFCRFEVLPSFVVADVHRASEEELVRRRDALRDHLARHIV